MFRVIRIGWDEENFIQPIVLLDRKTRRDLGIEVGQTVTISKDDTKVIGGVQVQFKELIGQGATVNSLLAERLGVKIGDEIEVKGVGGIGVNRLGDQNWPGN